MIDWSDFIKCERGLLIAPAGHGKTTAIADCLLQCPKDSCQLILTHTHAGIASLRTKFRIKNIPSNKYQLETITGFAQRYVLSILGSTELPNEEDKEYFTIAISKCCNLMQSKVVQAILKASFDGVFVDEYQDCTIDQHNMIMELAYNLPLHLLGDPLQGIFSFENKTLVDFNRDLGLFSQFNLLNHPWRWEKSNPFLGEYILETRKQLEAGHNIELKDEPTKNINVVIVPPNDDKYQIMVNIIKQHSLENTLVLCPSYRESNKYGKLTTKGDINDRIKIKQRVDYGNSFTIIDAIDSTEYYKCAKDIDSLIKRCTKGSKINMISKLHSILKQLHLNISEVEKWIDEKSVKKRKGNNLSKSLALKESCDYFEANVSLDNLKKLITLIVNLPSIKKYHRLFYSSIDKCFNLAQTNNISMFEAMKLLKTRVRHQGRQINGKSFGTTLLTKGLEFDTVILWNAHKFEDAKNFYVAISRACRKLIIITEKTTLSFNDNNSNRLQQSK
ncbi:UvrD-helicase domain-containing protein [Phocaeicola paurosaccharolyticus]|uniref:UvrD-helicase domain-containing protein n=1 Tax=Phocaeicola paurosaccharolyticus TaxID=732242 RepID=UPI000469144E|nr:UvrD-helicase domain-containing protein [Phocaeicola paurosaccharolyticus]